ncbi:MAG: hypothetical protein ABID67_00245 [Candidatus Nealsonbacteria bacterium]
MQKLVNKQNILSQVLVWWLKETPSKLILAWKNFLLFSFNYFSVVLLFKTLFSPWRRYKSSYSGGFDINKYLESFISNLIFRILGAIFRSILIILGLIVEAFILVIGFFILVLWILSPFIIVGLFLFGIKLIF